MDGLYSWRWSFGVITLDNRDEAIMESNTVCVSLSDVEWKGIGRLCRLRTRGRFVPSRALVVLLQFFRCSS